MTELQFKMYKYLSQSNLILLITMLSASGFQSRIETKIPVKFSKASKDDLKLIDIDKYTIDTILTHLPLSDVARWSATNKHWRRHFAPTLFSKLSLMFSYPNNHMVFSCHDEYFEREMNYFQNLADDWKPHAHWVKEVTVLKEMTKYSINIIFNQFQNITCLKFSDLVIDESNLLSILRRVKLLEELCFMDSRVCSKQKYFDQEDDFQLPSGLKVLRIDTNCQFSRVPLPFERFDRSHRLIREMTCLNANMATNFFRSYPTLTHIEIRNDPSFSSDIVRTILENNPQLRSLGVCSSSLDEFNMNLALKLKQLSHLSITVADIAPLFSWTFIDNTCIESLTLSGEYSPWHTRSLLHYLKAVKSLKLSHIRLATLFDAFDLYSPTIELVELVRLPWELLDFRPFLEFNALRKIAIREVYQVNAIEHIGREVERLTGWRAHFDECALDLTLMEYEDECIISRSTLIYLNPHFDKSNQHGILVCNGCQAHLAYFKSVVSKNFQGRSGKAYLIENCVNLLEEGEEDRHLLTGLHTVADVKCRGCDLKLGWKYIKTYNPTQSYKQGKFVIEKKFLGNFYPSYES